MPTRNGDPASPSRCERRICTASAVDRRVGITMYWKNNNRQNTTTNYYYTNVTNVLKQQPTKLHVFHVTDVGVWNKKPTKQDVFHVTDVLQQQLRNLQHVFHVTNVLKQWQQATCLQHVFHVCKTLAETTNRSRLSHHQVHTLIVINKAHLFRLIHWSIFHQSLPPLPSSPSLSFTLSCFLPGDFLHESSRHVWSRHSGPDKTHSVAS